MNNVNADVSLRGRNLTIVPRTQLSQASSVSTSTHKTYPPHPLKRNVIVKSDPVPYIPKPSTLTALVTATPMPTPPSSASAIAPVKGKEIGRCFTTIRFTTSLNRNSPRPGLVSVTIPAQKQQPQRKQQPKQPPKQQPPPTRITITGGPKPLVPRNGVLVSPSASTSTIAQRTNVSMAPAQRTLQLNRPHPMTPKDRCRANYTSFLVNVRPLLKTPHEKSILSNSRAKLETQSVSQVSTPTNRSKMINTKVSLRGRNLTIVPRTQLSQTSSVSTLTHKTHARPTPPLKRNVIIKSKERQKRPTRSTRGPKPVVPRNGVLDSPSTSSSTIQQTTNVSMAPVQRTIQLNPPGLTEDPCRAKYPSLAVTVRPWLKTPHEKSILSNSRAKLDETVKELVNMDRTKFVEWLLRKRLLSVDLMCDIHTPEEGSVLKLGKYNDVSKAPFSGGYIWVAECCRGKQVSVFYGSLFQGSTIPPNRFLKLIYHWACQTKPNAIVEDIMISYQVIQDIYTLLRSVCIAGVHQYIYLLGGKDKSIEVGLLRIQTARRESTLNKVSVLAAYDPITKDIRFRIVKLKSRVYPDDFPQSEKEIQDKLDILEPLKLMVHRESSLLIDKTLSLSTLREIGFRGPIRSTGDTPDVSPNGTAMKYLRRVVPKAFSTTLNVLCDALIQQFLDEMTWREKWGETPELAFNTIMDQLAQMTRVSTGPNLLNRLNEISMNPFVNCAWNPTMGQTSTEQLRAASASEQTPIVMLKPRTVNPNTRPADANGLNGDQSQSQNPFPIITDASIPKVYPSTHAPPLLAFDKSTVKLTTVSNSNTSQDRITENSHSDDFVTAVHFSLFKDVKTALVSPSLGQEKGIEVSVPVDNLCNGDLMEDHMHSGETEVKIEDVKSDEMDVDDETNLTNVSEISGTNERIDVVKEVMNMGNNNSTETSKWPRPAGTSRKRKHVFSRSVSEDIEAEIEVESEIREDEIEVIDLSDGEEDIPKKRKNSKTGSEGRSSTNSSNNSQFVESLQKPISESDNIISSWSDLISFPSQNIICHTDTSTEIIYQATASPEKTKNYVAENSVQVEAIEILELSPSTSRNRRKSIEPSLTARMPTIEEKFPWVVTTKLHPTAKLKLTLTSAKTPSVEADITILKRCARTPTVLLSRSGPRTKKNRLQNIMDTQGTGLVTADLMGVLKMPNQDWCVNTYPIPNGQHGEQLFTVSETIINSGLVEIIRKSITILPNWTMTFTVYSTPLKNFKFGSAASSTQDIQEILSVFGNLNVCEGIPRLGNYKYLPLFETRLRSTIDYCYRSPKCPLVLVEPTTRTRIPTTGPEGKLINVLKASTQKRCDHCREMKECLEFSGSRSHLHSKYEHLFE